MECGRSWSKGSARIGSDGSGNSQKGVVLLVEFWILDFVQTVVTVKTTMELEP